MKILLLNGPNMNMLGKRDPALYGKQTLADVENSVIQHAKTLGAAVECRQSNSEGTLIDILQQTDAQVVVMNGGAYSHYSYALRDCIESLGKPVVEVHMTDIYAREQFRHTDVLAEVCAKTFLGKGVQSYLEAVEYAVQLVK